MGRQPFGGAGMSGVGSKAGGRDYLLQFVEPRVITENTMRRGLPRVGLNHLEPSKREPKDVDAHRYFVSPSDR